MVKYWKLVFAKAFWLWCHFVWSEFVWTALLLFMAFALGAIIMAGGNGLWVPLQQWWSNPMANLQAWLVGGGIGVLALVGLSFLVCLFIIAPQQIHSDQLNALSDARRELGDAVSELKAAEDRYRPGLRASIIQMSSLPRSDAHAGPGINLIVRLINTGAPSIASGWRFAIRPAPDTEVHGQPIRISGEFRITAEGVATQVLHPKDWLAEKSSAHAIKQGEQLTGYLFFGFDKSQAAIIETAMNDGAVSLSFYDAEGTQHLALNECTGPISHTHVFPGMDVKVLPPPSKRNAGKVPPIA